MSIGRITYEDKIDYREQDVDERCKISAKDMNEIKNVFNDSATQVEATLQDTKNLQTELDEAIAITGTYKFENGKLYLMKANGEYGEGIELGGQTSIFRDGIVETNLQLKTEKNASANKVKVQLQDTEGNAVCVETSADGVFTDEGISMQKLLDGHMFFLSETTEKIVIGTYQEWIDNGCPKMS